MAQPPEPDPEDVLAEARQHLARAESLLMHADALPHLQEGLALLEVVIDDEFAAEARSTARNLGRAYAEQIFTRIEQAVGSARPTEPELEHVFGLLRAFDEACFELPPPARALKIEIVARLIDFYSEGQAPADRARLREQLARIASGPGDR